MDKEHTENKVTNKWKYYITGLMTRNFTSVRKLDKYFRVNITDSMAKAIEDNWLRILGMDYEIISVNMCKNNEPLGIALQGRNMFTSDRQEVMQRHFLRAIMPRFCVGYSNKFMIGDELLEVNGLRVNGMRSKDVVSALKKLPNYIQMVVARPHTINNGCATDFSQLEEIHSPISFYDMDEDLTSQTCTLKSYSSLFSGTSRDYGSTVSVLGLIDGRYDNVTDYLKTIIGWRGPIVLEFRKRSKESLGLALEEIKDPKTNQLIIVFKIILPVMRAAKDGRLHVGDRLLHVNGKSVNGVAFKKVCQWMKSAPGGRLVLCICKPHFPEFDLESADYLLDNNLYQTLNDTDKLPKLHEEINEEVANKISPVPENVKRNLVIKCNGDKLGIFLDLVDNGINGCRIKKIARGPVKDDGTLKEGDHITMINSVSLRIDEKNMLENCLRTIAQFKDDYTIAFLRKEDIASHKQRYSSTVRDKDELDKERAPTETMSYNPDVVLSREHVQETNKSNCYDKADGDTSSFVKLYITIPNDGCTNLGLVLVPSLNDPTRYVSIIDIHRDSLADKTQLLKINDELLTVNEKSLEFLSLTTVSRQLIQTLQRAGYIELKIRRLVGVDDEANLKTVENKYQTLSDLPDFYFCSLLKSKFGYGFSVLDLLPGYGVVIEDIYPQGVSSQTGTLNCGDRIVLINNCPVSSCVADIVIKIIKNPQNSIGLIMEKPKFREFFVRIVKDSSNSFGLNVAGGIDTKSRFAIIESIVPDTDCQYSESLRPDDIIVDANAVSMLNRYHDEIIRDLRVLPNESVFKIWRQLPFSKRDFVNNTNTVSALMDHLQNSQFSVTINKPVSSIPTFGISFNDILILDKSNMTVMHRYKAVISITRDSLCEKYAPEVIAYCYLVAVNGTPIDVNMSCADLKKMIDSQNSIELLLSRDIPYVIDPDDQCEPPPYLTEESNGSELNNDSDHQLSESLNQLVLFDHTDSGIIADHSIGIRIFNVIVPKLDSVELGFRVFGGVNGGPDGETLPVYVVDVVQNTCNWPSDRAEPWLSNGCQLLEVNGANLLSMDATTVQRLLTTIDCDWNFKVLRFDV